MLVGKNVKIRAIEKTDLELSYAWMSNQENVGGFMDAHLVHKESFIEGMEVLIKDKSKLFTMIEDSNGKSIGIMNYREVPGSTTTLEIGILIAESSVRGKGFGRECLQLFIDYIFNTKNVMRIQFLTRVENAGMKVIGEKAGFTLEGVLKKYKLEQGDYRDYSIMAVTREEWSLKKTKEGVHI
ncbi:MAG TPA: GNAT family protein [Clostridia bacterium]|nr:GNAT family protein [Clostridia bacterium]